MAASQGDPAPAGAGTAIVLDTNAVLDWLLFHDPGMAAAAAAVQARQVRWCVCSRLREELAHTLNKAALLPRLRAGDSERILTTFDTWAERLPPPITTDPLLRCRDASDQIFIDLALACGARWLLTHDRALLRLRRRALARGLLIVRPGEWPGPGAPAAG